MSALVKPATLGAGKRIFEELLIHLVSECKKEWPDELQGILLFGSTVDQIKPATDIDLIICVSNLPPRRRERLDLFDPIESRMEPWIQALRGAGHSLIFSPKLRTLDEVLKFSPLYLDLPAKSRILFEKDRLFTQLIEKIRSWIQTSGAYKVTHGLKWYWVLKPDARWDSEFHLGWTQ